MTAPSVGRARTPSPRQAILAGGAYFANVFAVAFMLGVVRTLVIEPRIGHLAAVMAEAPIMIAVSLDAAIRVIDARNLPQDTLSRTIMGAVALVLLIGAEFLLALVVGIQPVRVLGNVTGTAGAVSLSAFAIYALLPVVLGWAARRKQRRAFPG